MKVVIAPDSFKETLTAAEVARAIGEGVLSVVPDAAVALCPMADGGEGTVAAMVAATGGQYRTVDVFDPLGRPIRARFGLLGRRREAALPGALGLMGALEASSEDEAESEEEFDEGPHSGRTAVIEMAEASGLALVPAALRDPLRTTTFGTGQLILAALDAGAAEIVLGIGGSATTDGGAGSAQALGVVFREADGEPAACGLCGGRLGEISGIDVAGRDERISRCRIRVACDVTHPLLGERGAARVFAPQKGADAESVQRLEENLAHLARLIERDLGLAVAEMAGAGAAGGLGAGLVAFAGASLEGGAELVAEAIGLRRRLAGADLVFTGEGRLDATSACGKATGCVAAAARQAHVPAICIPGQADANCDAAGFAAVWPLVGGSVTGEQAMADPVPLLRRRAAEAIRHHINS